MKPGIYFKKIWFDDDLIEIQLHSSDGESLFSNRVYIGHQDLKNLIAELNDFKDKLYGGIYDLRIGAFGPEYASGAYHARLHFHQRSRIHITIEAQSEFEDFGMKKVATEATLYLISEPILLESFIVELKALSEGSKDEAKFEAV